MYAILKKKWLLNQYFAILSSTFFTSAICQINISSETIEIFSKPLIYSVFEIYLIFLKAARQNALNLTHI